MGSVLEMPRRKRRLVKRSLSVREVGVLLGVSETTVRQWCDSGVLPGHRLHTQHRRIPVASVRAYMRAHGIDERLLDEFLEAIS